MLIPKKALIRDLSIKIKSKESNSLETLLMFTADGKMLRPGDYKNLYEDITILDTYERYKDQEDGILYLKYVR